VLHMLIVKKDVFSFLAKPLATAQFGKNKTWRGFLLLPMFNGFLFFLLNKWYPFFGELEALTFGCLLGLVYLIFELPNSFLKRKLGIDPGEKAKKNAFLFMLMDKMDSAFGVCLLSKVIFKLEWQEVAKLFLLAVFLHVIFSFLLTVIGLKKRF